MNHGQRIVLKVLFWLSGYSGLVTFANFLPHPETLWGKGDRPPNEPYHYLKRNCGFQQNVQERARACKTFSFRILTYHYASISVSTRNTDPDSCSKFQIKAPSETLWLRGIVTWGCFTFFSPIGQLFSSEIHWWSVSVLLLLPAWMKITENVLV